MEHLLFDLDEGVGTLTVNRPQALNALNGEVIEELLNFLVHPSAHEGMQALILTGAGEKAFIAGADIKEMEKLNHLEMLKLCSLGQAVGNALENAPFPTIAAVNGYALGGGLEMALACDFIYCSTKAKLGLPEITLGLIPGFGGTQRLSRAVGTRRAKEMIMNGKPVDAQKAKEIGIVNEIFDPEDLLEACHRAAKEIIAYSPIALIQAKRAINHGYSLAMADALELEKNMFAVCFDTPERAKAMRQFIEKREKARK